MALVTISGCSKSPEGPYDASADPVAQYQDALLQADAQNKRVLIMFGANWCPDCRAFSKELNADPLRQLVADNFVTLYVNIGNWDANMNFVARFGKPVAQGIPSIAIADSDGAVRFVTVAGELGTVRQTSSQELYEWFKRLLSGLDQGPENEQAGS